MPTNTFFNLPAEKKHKILKAANIKLDDILDVKISDGMITLVKPFRHKTSFYKKYCRRCRNS